MNNNLKKDDKRMLNMKTRLSKLKLLVVGDVIVDEIVNVNVKRVSPEAPVLIANFIENDFQAGGAANVALNAISTGVQCALLGFVGKDKNGAKLLEILDDKNVENLIIELPEVNTIIKSRICSDNTQLLRLDKDVSFEGYEKYIVNALDRYATNFDGVIVSDYGKGTVTDLVFKEIIRLSEIHKFKVFVDPKSSNALKYRGATTLTPNRKEFEIYVGESSSFEEMASNAKKLVNLLGLEFLLITLSELGMLLIYPNGDFEHIQTNAKEIYDVTGAGDTVIAIFAALCTAGHSPHTSAKIANSAAGIVVGQSGASKLSSFEFESIIDETKENNISRVEDLKKQREKMGKIVMTNGCFDLIHKGHVEYLKKAKSLGQTLIVAINSDSSVAKLKGVNRPINSVEDRAYILKGLKYVDFVVTFDELTPIELYKQFTPDILVKGGDYNNKEVIGKNLVEKNGGEVILIDFLDGYSSTKIINKIRNTAEQQQ